MIDNKPNHEDPFSRASALLAGHRVLVVEDNDINAKVVCRLLEAAAVATEVAVNGQEAIGKMNDSFTAVLMDVEMPVLDGLEATRRLRQLSQFSAIPIIAMTGYGHETDRLNCQQAGMDGFLVKPIEPLALLETLCQLCGQSEKAATRPIPPRAPAERPEKEVLNSEEGLSKLGHDQQLYSEILHDFLEKHDQTVNSLRNSLASGDRKQAQTLAHLLKGVAGTIRAEKLAQQSQLLFSLLNESDPAESDEQEALRRLESTYAQTIKQIHLFLKG